MSACLQEEKLLKKYIMGQTYRQSFGHHLCSCVSQCLTKVIKVFQICLQMNNKNIH